MAVSEESIYESQLELAGMGLFVQPASAVSLAALKKLRQTGSISSEQRAACILTGSGLKYTAVFDAYNLNAEECLIDDLEKLLAVK